MEEIQSQLETLIDDVERDETMTKTDIVLALYKLKEQIEEILEEANAYNLRKEVEDQAKNILQKDDILISRVDAYLMAYNEIIDDLD